MFYEYMVVYSMQNGAGRIQITRTKEINSYSELEELDKYISGYCNIPKVIVTDFKLLRTYEK